MRGHDFLMPRVHFQYYVSNAYSTRELTTWYESHASHSGTKVPAGHPTTAVKPQNALCTAQQHHHSAKLATKLANLTSPARFDPQ
jgi:hypothetical protein